MNNVKELLEKKKIKKLKLELENINEQDLSELFEEVNEEDMIVLFRLLSKEKAAETFAYMNSDIQEHLIKAFTDKELKDITNELFVDDTVDLIEEMPSNVVKRILKNISKEQRTIINEILKFPKDSAGSIMTTELVDLKENMTVEDAFNKIKKTGVDKETIYTCYVVTMERKLIGSVSAKDLLLSEKDELIKNIMDTNIIVANTLDDREEVAKKFDKYDVLAIPVVDTENRLVGIITIDDAIDVIQEENREDFEKMAAITPSKDDYFKTSTVIHAKNRIMWLLILMLSSTVTGAIITKYEAAFATLPLLVSFIPMIMGTGGNCGSQSSTLIIRGLAMDEITLKDFWKAMFKEFRIAILVGTILSIANGARIIIQYHDLKLAIIVACTLICTVILSKLLGCILPMLSKKLKLDPALMAAPLITTIVDTCSVLIFFKVAMIILKL